MTASLAGETIGFIGLGNMGFPMARHLHSAGARVVVWNRTRAVIDRAVQNGMQAAASLADLAQAVGAGVVCMNLTTTDVVEQLAFGTAGLSEQLDQRAIVVDFGTTGVDATKRFAQRVRWVDAPVSGGQVGAEAASLSIFVGGTDEDVQRVMPIFKVVGKRITHLGSSGAGQVAKLANQLIVAQTIDAVAQAMRLAELAGLDALALREAMLGGFADSRILDLHGKRMATRNFVAGGRAALQLKDVRLICELAASLGFESPTLANSLAQWEKLVHELGRGELDHSGLFTLYQDDAV